MLAGGFAHTSIVTRLLQEGSLRLSGSETWPGLWLFKFQGWVTEQKGSVIALCSVTVQNRSNPCVPGGRREVLNVGNGRHAAALWGCNQGLTSDAIFCVFSDPKEWNRTNVSALVSALWR